MKLSRYLIGTTVMASSLTLAPIAIGQQGTSPGQPGTTTGPASGTPVEPSKAVQKQNRQPRQLREPLRAPRPPEPLAHLAGQERRVALRPAQHPVP